MDEISHCKKKEISFVKKQLLFFFLKAKNASAHSPFLAQVLYSYVVVYDESMNYFPHRSAFVFILRKCGLSSNQTAGLELREGSRVESE